MIELDCAVKHDDWGNLGTSSLVGQLLASQRRTVNESIPYAELWMGTHQSGPSRVTGLSPDFDSKPIDCVLKAWPEFVGNIDIASKYGSNLPILVKMISIDRPLPLQLNVKTVGDAAKSHKIIIALTHSSLLCGFRSHCEIVDHLERFSILRSLISSSTFSRYIESVSDGNLNPSKSTGFYMKQCFKEALDSCQAKQLTSTRLIKSFDDGKFDEAISRLKKLVDKGLDAGGLIAFLFMNHVCLIPDQAILIDPYQVHKFLEGNYLEVSNPNDQVIRDEAKLDNYIESSSMSNRSLSFIDPICTDNASHLYSHETSDLTVELINVNSSDDDHEFLTDYRADATLSGSFILVLGLTETTVNNVYRMKPGQIFFAPPGLPLRFTHLRGAFRLFRFSLKL